MTSRMRAAGLALAIAAGLLVAGCGGDEGGSPEDAVEAYADAARDADGEAACELISSASVEAIEEFGDDCPAAFEEFGGGDVPDDLEIGEVTEDGDTATVETTGDGETTEIPLVREDDEWKIDFTNLAAEAEAPEVESVEPETETVEPVEPAE